MKYYYIICRISHTIIIKADSIEEVQEVVNKDCQPIDEPQIVCYLDVPETVTIESLEQRMKGEGNRNTLNSSFTIEFVSIVSIYKISIYNPFINNF